MECEKTPGVSLCARGLGGVGWSREEGRTRFKTFNSFFQAQETIYVSFYEKMKD